MRAKTMTVEMLKKAWEMRESGLAVKAIAVELGVPAPTLYRNLAGYQHPQQLVKPTKEETIAKIRSVLGRPLEETSRAFRMQTMFMLRGAPLTDAILCEAMEIEIDAFRTYLRNADSQGLTQRSREDAEISSGLRELLEQHGSAEASSRLLVLELRERFGIATSVKRVDRLLGRS